jgi:hypothetical protein
MQDSSAKEVSWGQGARAGLSLGFYPGCNVNSLTLSEPQLLSGETESYILHKHINMFQGCSKKKP